MRAVADCSAVPFDGVGRHRGRADGRPVDQEVDLRHRVVHPHGGDAGAQPDAEVHVRTGGVHGDGRGHAAHAAVSGHGHGHAAHRGRARHVAHAVAAAPTEQCRDTRDGHPGERSMDTQSGVHGVRLPLLRRVGVVSLRAGSLGDSPKSAAGTATARPLRPRER